MKKQTTNIWRDYVDHSFDELLVAAGLMVKPKGEIADRKQTKLPKLIKIK